MTCLTVWCVIFLLTHLNVNLNHPCFTTKKDKLKHFWCWTIASLQSGIYEKCILTTWKVSILLIMNINLHFCCFYPISCLDNITVTERTFKVRLTSLGTVSGLFITGFFVQTTSTFFHARNVIKPIFALYNKFV